MGRISEWEGPSERAARIIFASLAVVIASFIVLSILVPGFGKIEGRHDIVDIGETLDIRISSLGNERVNITVTELQLVSPTERAEWRFGGPFGLDDLRDDEDIYLIHFTIDSEASVIPSMWRLLDAEGNEHRAMYASMPTEARCERSRGDAGLGCIVVIVPAGAEITMVRYYGVKTPFRKYKPVIEENWAGWTP